MARTPKIWVEEFEHAYLIHGTGLIDEARKAVFKFLGSKKWTRIVGMPYRPFWNGEPGGPGESAVAMYFNIGERCVDESACEFCSNNPRNEYKP